MLSPPSPFLLALLDVVLSSVLVAPMVVAYWRGTWQVMDLCLLPLVGEPAGSYISLAIGLVLHLIFTLLRPLLRFAPFRPRVTFFIFSRAYTALFGIACVNCWRGAWKVLDHLVGISPTADGTTFTVALLVLAVTRTLRNISAPPFAVAIDTPKDYFHFQTAFRTIPTPAENGREQQGVKEPDATYRRHRRPFIARVALASWCAFKYVVDCVVSVVVIGSLVVVVWRGAWYILDQTIFPKNPEWSAWGSLVLGYSIVVFVYSLQIPAKSLCRRLKRGVTRLVIADIYVFASFCGTVNVWRGIWNLLNIFAFPENPHLSNWLTVIFPLLILIGFRCSNSILVRGVLVDGEEDNGVCVVFPILYVRHFVESKHKRVNHGASSDENLQTVKLGDAAQPLATPNHHSKELDVKDFYKGRVEGDSHGKQDNATSSLAEDVEREMFIARAK